MKDQSRHPRLDATQALDAPPVDPERVAAVGYCFGGRCVLDLVRGGGAAGVRGVVSLHGVLDAQPLPAGVARIEAAVLICHGDADPFTPPAALDACVAQLRAHCTQWQLNTYGGAPHAWTNPAQRLNSNPAFGSIALRPRPRGARPLPSWRRCFVVRKHRRPV